MGELATGLSGSWYDLTSLIIVRGLLALVNAGALLSLRNAITTAFGNAASNWYIILQASQFHVVYYASRTLPNMYAFAMSTSKNLSFRFTLLTLDFSNSRSEKLHRRRIRLNWRSGSSKALQTIPVSLDGCRCYLPF
jgi:hypothetical protein